ncbi:glycosyltransferase family 4 protein [Deinococcus deserti]|uniref:Putative glycosyltransferase n=1 Tax=Deinococcus deserti (strain DSM 17065 / CIP 109153 / LMG 22923 / VCD115) TaxID=546414 RepID=C1CY81_DEIDV|nr:glycosyltransferase family 4 protein [Deinococcus deserti]ACO47037.1 putative glycosyltransferase [Deinococcus deserti VCD115]
MTPFTCRPHVVLIAHYAPWLINFRAPLLKAIRAGGCRVTVLAPGQYPEIRMQLLEIGVDYQSFSMDRTGLNPSRDLRTIIELYHLLRDAKATHVLTTAIKPNIYGALAARWAGVDNIYALVTGLGHVFTGNSYKQRTMAIVASVLYRIAFSGVKKVIFQNPDDRELFLKRKMVSIAQTALVAGSGVDLNHYQASALPASPPIKFLMIARLIKEKGVREYVQAASLLKMKGINVKVQLAGPLDDNPSALSASELKTLVDDGNIQYLGELQDVRDALAESHVFVLPSYREGTPRSTLEALATGRPVITTDAPGCRETVEPGVNGLLVPIGDAQALAEAMESFTSLAAPLQEMAEASLLKARLKYDVHLVNSEMLKIMKLDVTSEL